MPFSLASRRLVLRFERAISLASLRSLRGAFTRLVSTFVLAVCAFPIGVARADEPEAPVVVYSVAPPPAPVPAPAPAAAPAAAPSAALAPVPEEPPSHRRSTGAMIGGIALTAAGVGLFAAAYAFGHPDEQCEWTKDSKKWTVDGDGLSQNGPTCKKVTSPSVPLAVAGLASIGVGIPLWIWGGHHVRDEPDAPLAAAARPVLVVGARGGSLRWSF